ncbi:MAG: hypothetical protein IKF68_00420 [Erysipelotrichaceae bacterium]|nr:hypothetical protein [Erysipelotrichaceae bacterium]
MKYGESTFDILYLLFAIGSGIFILRKAEDKRERHMGYAALVLGCGDAFHLVPRVLNYFVNSDMTAALGIGKLITSLTMTVFYVFLYYLWIEHYHEQRNRSVDEYIWMLAGLRFVLCLFPQNGWLTNDSDMVWGIIRNIPFIIQGAFICSLYYRNRNEEDTFRNMWLYILLSFLFYMPVAVAAGIVPMLGMLMLPKTVCYILMIVAFLKSLKK